MRRNRDREGIQQLLELSRRVPSRKYWWLTRYLSTESCHILDWFHLTMRLTVLHPYALGLTQVDAAGGKLLQECLNSIKWYLWHGNAKRAVGKTTDLDAVFYQHLPAAEARALAARFEVHYTPKNAS